MSKLYCRVLSLDVLHPSEEDGDEIFLAINDKKVWPDAGKYVSVKNGTVKINLLHPVEEPNTAIPLDLYENDGLFFNKKLGSFILNVQGTGGPFRTDLVRGSSEYARYSLEWEVVVK